MPALPACLLEPLWDQLAALLPVLEEFAVGHPLGCRSPGDLVSDGFQGRPAHLLQEFRRNAFNVQVGQTLLGETGRIRVWEIRLAPGERVPAHRHVLDYFWTAITGGRSRQHTDEGPTREVEYHPGENRHFSFRPGQYLLHDLENTGPTPLVFTTVEFKDSPNAPLPLGS